MKKYLVIPLFLLFFTNISYSQSLLNYLRENTSNADIIVEGFIEKTESYRSNNGQIYTKNHLSYERIIKGDGLQNGTIIIETPGGKVDGEESTCFHCAELVVNEKGLFFLKAVNKKYILLNGNAGKVKKINIDEDRQGIVSAIGEYIPDWIALVSCVERIVNGENITQNDLKPRKEELCFKIDNVKIINERQISVKVYVKSDEPNLKFGGAEISIKYPTNSLGSYVVQNNVLEATTGSFISNTNVYSVSISDVSAEEFKLEVVSGCTSSITYAILNSTYQEIAELILEVDLSQIDDIVTNSQIIDAKGKFFSSIINDCSEFSKICLDGELLVATCNITSIDIIGDAGAGIGSMARFIGEDFGDSPGKVKLPDADIDMGDGIILENLDETLLSWSNDTVEINITALPTPGIMGSGKWRIDPSGAFNFSCFKKVNINFSMQQGTVTDIDSVGNSTVKSKYVKRYGLDTLQGAISYYLDNTINSNTSLSSQGLTFDKIELLVKQALCEWEDKTGISLNYLGGIDPALYINTSDAKNVIYFADAATVQALSMGTHTGAFTTHTVVVQPGCIEVFSSNPNDTQIRHPYSIDTRTVINEEYTWYDKNSNSPINTNEEDLFTFLLHETGHSLGLDHAIDADNNGPDDTRIMYPGVETTTNNISKHSIDNGDTEGGVYIAQKSRELLESPNLLTFVCVNDFALSNGIFCTTTAVDNVLENSEVFKVIPNICSVHEEIFIKNELGYSMRLIVSNSLGVKIDSFGMAANDTKVYKFQNKGVYFISSIVEGHMFTQKIIVQ